MYCSVPAFSRIKINLCSQHRRQERSGAKENTNENGSERAHQLGVRAGSGFESRWLP